MFRYIYDLKDKNNFSPGVDVGDAQHTVENIEQGL